MNEQEEYIGKIDQALRRCMLERDHSPWQLLRGVFPALASERSFALFGDDTLLAGDCGRSEDYLPQLHPIDFEWYFDSQTAEFLTKEVASSRGVTTCLGTPTVANLLVKSQRRCRFVDANSRVLSRFRSLRSLSEVQIGDVSRAPLTGTNSDCVIFDSPWSAMETERWLCVASTLVKKGGVIAFSLFPSLVRPSAIEERNSILDLANRLGNVTVFENRLRYQTPHFEKRTLSVNRKVCFGNWRMGDLVVVRTTAPGENPKKHSSNTNPQLPEWETIQIGDQIIKLRLKTVAETANREIALEKLPGLTGWTYDTVSSRDSRRSMIDVWTSKNKVARASNLSALRWLLILLSKGFKIRTVFDEIDSLSLDTPKKTGLKQDLVSLLN